jgi:hypothetical protein
MQVSNNDESSRLLKAVAEQLKLPLMQIARQAELSRTLPPDLATWQQIQISADMAILMVEHYLFGLDFVENQAALLLEPVSVASVLNDTAHQLSPLARQYDVDIELEVAGKYAPVMAHAVALQTALVSLGCALLTAPKEVQQRPVIMLAVRQNRQGIVAGLYGNYEVSAAALKRARVLYGRSRQPLVQLGGGAAGIFVADIIFDAMSSPLRAARFHKLSGLAATLLPSQQLQLI